MACLGGDLCYPGAFSLFIFCAVARDIVSVELCCICFVLLWCMAYLYGIYGVYINCLHHFLKWMLRFSILRMNDHPGMNVHFVQVYFVQVTYAINTNTKQTGCRQNTVIVKTSTMSSKIILIRGGTNRQRDRQTDWWNWVARFAVTSYTVKSLYWVFGYCNFSYKLKDVNRIFWK